MKVLITGSSGQLGQALIATKPDYLANSSLQLVVCTRSELDLTDMYACHSVIDDHRPDWVLNAGAYTAVDRAQHEPELAQTVNELAPGALATSQAKHGGQMLQLSTDFVFGGNQAKPFSPHQSVNPLSVYGITKAAGEVAVQNVLGHRAKILRTSWVYGPVGKNFVNTILSLHQEREEIQVVADQISCPTSTFSLANACWRVIEKNSLIQSKSLHSILHWSDAGVASWYDFAEAIGELWQELGQLKRKANVVPITTAEFPTTAKRPSFSLLDCSETRNQLGLEPIHWRKALRQVLLTRLQDMS